jgi:hypothetical protein
MLTDELIYRRGDKVIWQESRTWGGKQNTPAEFVEYRGDKSARIKIGDVERTVRRVWLHPAARNYDVGPTR